MVKKIVTKLQLFGRNQVKIWEGRWWHYIWNAHINIFRCI